MTHPEVYQQRARFIAERARPEMHKHGAAAFRSLVEFMRKRAGAREFRMWMRSTKFLCVDYSAVLYVEGTGELGPMWRHANAWVNGPGTLVGFTAVEQVVFCDSNKEGTGCAV